MTPHDILGKVCNAVLLGNREIRDVEFNHNLDKCYEDGLSI